MFESSVVETRLSRRSLKRVRGLNVSIVAHVVAVAAWLIVGIVRIDFPDAPPDQWQAYTLQLLVNTPPPAPPPPPPPRRASVTAPDDLPDFAPEVIPDLIPELIDIADQGQTDTVEDSPAGVLGGVEGGVMGGVIGGLIQGELGGQLGGTVGSVAIVRKPGDPLIVPRDASLPISARRRVFPIYPRDAQLRALEGTVILRYVIDKKGKVREVEIVRQARYRPFNASAVEAIRQWQFEPFVENGEPVEIVHELTIFFELVRG